MLIQNEVDVLCQYSMNELILHSSACVCALIQNIPDSCDETICAASSFRILRHLTVKKSCVYCWKFVLISEIPIVKQLLYSVGVKSSKSTTSEQPEWSESQVLLKIQISDKQDDYTDWPGVILRWFQVTCERVRKQTFNIDHKVQK